MTNSNSNKSTELQPIEPRPTCSLFLCMLVCVLLCSGANSAAGTMPGNTMSGNTMPGNSMPGNSMPGNGAGQQEDNPEATTNPEDASPKGPPKRSEFESPELAWEFDPYQVKIWICHDQSSYINSNFDALKSGLESECISVDSSGWRVQVESAPLPWNWKLLLGEDLNLFSKDLVGHPDMAGFDKLICVRVRNELGRFHYDAQELDVKTEQWGARNVRVVDNRASLVQSLTAAVSKAFMPLARVDKAIDKQVKLRVRASGLMKYVVFDKDDKWQLVDNLASPVSVTKNDVFLPVIRKLDRDGHLERIIQIKWALLSIVEMGDPLIECKSISRARLTPLAGRVGRKTQRYALVIRAPNRPTILKLTTKDKENPRPLPGLQVYSRPSDVAPPGLASQPLGETDWRGLIEIPPNSDPMRVLYVKSGIRPLARLPMVPGLFDTMVSDMPNDEKRLYAEGVYFGMQYELMDLVAQRNVISTLVGKRLEDGEFAEAQEIITQLRGIDNSIEFDNKLNNELKRLQSKDVGEAKRISAMFSELQEISGKQLSTTLETLLSRKLAVAKEGGEWKKVTLDGVVVDTSDVVTEELEDEEGSDTESPATQN